MCLGCLPGKSIDEYCNFIHNKDRWIKCGKSNKFFSGKLHMGCPSGKRKCKDCSVNPSTKSLKHAKGKNKRNMFLNNDT